MASYKLISKQNKDDVILLQLVAEIPWGYNLLIMNKIRNRDGKKYYIKATIENGWTKDALGIQIKGNAYCKCYYENVEKLRNRNAMSLVELPDPEFEMDGFFCFSKKRIIFEYI